MANCNENHAYYKLGNLAGSQDDRIAYAQAVLGLRLRSLDQVAPDITVLIVEKLAEVIRKVDRLERQEATFNFFSTEGAEEREEHARSERTRVYELLCEAARPGGPDEAPDCITDLSEIVPSAA